MKIWFDCQYYEISIRLSFKFRFKFIDLSLNKSWIGIKSITRNRIIFSQHFYFYSKSILKYTKVDYLKHIFKHLFVEKQKIKIAFSSTQMSFGQRDALKYLRFKEFENLHNMAKIQRYYNCSSRFDFLLEAKNESIYLYRICFSLLN